MPSLRHSQGDGPILRGNGPIRDETCELGVRGARGQSQEAVDPEGRDTDVPLDTVHEGRARRLERHHRDAQTGAPQSILRPLPELLLR